MSESIEREADLDVAVRPAFAGDVPEQVEIAVEAPRVRPDAMIHQHQMTQLAVVDTKLVSIRSSGRGLFGTDSRKKYNTCRFRLFVRRGSEQDRSGRRGKDCHIGSRGTPFLQLGNSGGPGYIIPQGGRYGVCELRLHESGRHGVLHRVRDPARRPLPAL